MAKTGVKGVKISLPYDLVEAMDLMALKVRQQTHTGKFGVGNIAERLVLRAAQQDPEFQQALALVRERRRQETENHLLSVPPTLEGDEPSDSEDDLPVQAEQ